MKIVFLTTDDPLYLPAFFDRVLEKYASQTIAVYAVPPLYKNQTSLQAAWRYFRTFGFRAALGLLARVALAKAREQSVEASCKKRNVAYGYIADVNAPSFLEHLRSTGADLLVSVSCPQIFKKTLIDLPRLGCLNIHGAILPHYRGVLPSFWMLANGEKQAGVSIYYVNEKIDAGELCGQRIFDIAPRETLDTFLKKSKTIAADVLMETFARITAGTVTRIPLNLAEGSYYSWPNQDAVRRFCAKGRRVW